jgi:acetyl esterase/lipase
MPPGSLSFRQRVELRAARALAALPPRAQVRLSGKPPIRIDGNTLEPEIQLSLAMIERQGARGYEDMTPAEARDDMRQRTAVAAGPPLPVGAVRDLTVDGAAGPLRARHYAPDEAGGPHPLLVYYHGGGWVIGDLDTHDSPCRMLARHAGVHVLSIDYRMGPEDRFPAAVDDARAALRWAFAHAAELGADPSRVCVGGDSAGGNLSAVVSWLATHDGGPAPVFQLLVYPVTDLSEKRPSHRHFAEGFLLTDAEMDWFRANYLSSEDDRRDPRVSILLADSLAGLPPALVVTAGFDPLRDEGEAFAQALRDAGNVVAHRRFPGLIHGFFNLSGVSRVSRDAVVEIAGATRALLATVAARTEEPVATA